MKSCCAFAQIAVRNMNMLINLENRVEKVLLTKEEIQTPILKFCLNDLLTEVKQVQVVGTSILGYVIGLYI